MLCIQKGKDEYHFFCSVCFKDVSCSHQGLSDVKRYIQYQGHQQAVKHAVGETQGSVSTFMVPEPLQDKITSAEIKMTVFLAKHNLIAISDEFGKLFRSIFCDSNIEKKYQCGKTKSSPILNDALAVDLTSKLVERMKATSFSVATDESNDTGLEKMNPVTKDFYVNQHNYAEFPKEGYPV